MNLIVIGDGGHSKVIREIASTNLINIIGILDDKFCFPFKEKNVTYAPIDYIFEMLNENYAKVIIGIGDNHIRSKVYNKLNLPRKQYTNLIHKSAIVSENISIGVGNVIMPLSIINSNVKIGDHCIVNSGTIIEHDCKISNYVHLSPRTTLAGGVQIGEHAHLGTSSTVIPNKVIGENVVIGAGGVVVNDIISNTIAVGVPAKIITQ